MRGLAIDNRLEAIAGKPAGMLVGPGSVAVSRSGPYDDLWLFGVWDPFTTTAFKVLADIGSSSVGGIRFSSDSAGTALGARFDTVSGSSNVTYAIAKHTRRVAICAGTVSGLTSRVVQATDGTNNTAALTPGTGIATSPTLSLYNITEAPCRALAAYVRPLTPYQRTAIMAKLLQMVA